MAKDDISTEETQKTAMLLGLGNLLLAPIYYFNAKVGLTASVAFTGAALYQLHELGKERRPVGNFFSSRTGSGGDIDNIVKNIVSGGAALYDEMTPAPHH